LPDAAVEGGEPAAVTTVGVETDQVAEVQNFHLRRMAKNGRLAGEVRAGDVISQGKPAEGLLLLAVEGKSER
jgi:hypothetical protein